MSWNFLALHKRASGVRQTASEGGFGLVELMVSISIMAIVSSIILTRQTSFNSAILLRSQVYEIALDAREIQLSAVSALGDVGGTGEFRSVLGLHFDIGNNKSYLTFRDADDNNFYDPVEAFGALRILDPRFEIREIREAGTANTYNQLSIIFVRPNFDARFFDAANSERNISGVEIDIARVGADPSATGPGVLRTLEITSTGQIAVK